MYSSQIENKTKDQLIKELELLRKQNEEVKICNDIYDALTDAIFMVNNEGEVVLWNKAAEKMFGYSKDDVIGIPVHKLLIPDRYFNEYIESLKKFNVSERYAVFDKTLTLAGKRKNGEAFEAEYACTIVHINNTACLICVVRDIARSKRLDTQKRRAQFIVNFSRACEDIGELQTVFKLATYGLSEQLNVSRASVWMLDDFGDLVCRQLYDIKCGKHSEGMILKGKNYPNYIKAILNNKAIVAHDARKDQRTREFLNSHLTPFYIYSMLDIPIKIKGKIHGVISLGQTEFFRRWEEDEIQFAINITEQVSSAVNNIKERKRAEEEKKKFSSLLTSVMNSTHDLIFAKDQELRMILCNEAFAKVVGKKPGEIIGKTDIENGWDHESVQYLLQKGIIGSENDDRQVLKGNNIRNHSDLTNIANTSRIYDTQKVPLYDSRGKIFGLLSVSRDITARKKAEQELERIFELSIDMICIADISKGFFTKINPSFSKTLGFSEKEILGKPFMHFIHPEDREKTQKAIKEKLFQGIKVINFENRYLCKNDSYKWLMWNVNPIPEQGITYAIAHDITEKRQREEELKKHRDQLEKLVANRTAALSKANNELKQEIIERKQVEEELKNSEQKYRRLIEGLRENYIFYSHNVEGVFTYVSPSITVILGYTPEEFLTHYSEYLTDNPINEEVIHYTELSIKGIKQLPYEVEVYHKDGSLRMFQVQEVPVFDKNNNVVAVEGIARDVTEIKRFQSQLVFLADHDPLTCLFNRRRFINELERCLIEAQRYQSKGALLFLDLDNFKYINDTLGHQYGDELLITLTNALKERIRHSDILARLGGDEFAIILPHTDEVQARLISQKLLELVKNNLTIDKVKHLDITVSIGIALFPAHGNNAEVLLTNADLAMYQAKEEGRNRDCIFSPEHKLHIESRFDWEKRIKIALEQNKFVLLLQPIVSLQSRKTLGYEALLRMVDENEKLIQPSNFLDIAERFGLVCEIDHWVVSHAINIIKVLELPENGLFLEVNLSGKAFSDNELLPKIRRKMEKNWFDPKTLIFEITETAIIENMVEAQHFILTLKSLGCRFALDDFGSGFSSFNYLKHLPVDYLKIDGNFIQDLPHNAMDQHLVKAMVEVARGLKKLTVAEFVGSEETMQLLKKLGVDYAQGHYIGEPCQVTDVLQIMKKGTNKISGSG